MSQIPINRYSQQTQVIAYFDAGYDSDNKRGSYAFIIYIPNDKAFDKLEYFGKFKNKSATSELAELFSLELCIDKCLELNFKNVLIFGDCKSIIEEVNGIIHKKSQRKMDTNIIRVREKINELEQYQLLWTPRDNNYRANTLAKRVMRNEK